MEININSIHCPWLTGREEKGSKKPDQSTSINDVRYERISVKKQGTLGNLKENKKGFNQGALLPFL